jgi:hypothetical protein
MDKGRPSRGRAYTSKSVFNLNNRPSFGFQLQGGWGVDGVQGG